MDKKRFFTLFVLVFIDLLGFGIIIPVLPYYAQSMGASALQLGMLMGTYSAAQFIFAPLWGRWSDSVGRRPVLLICLLGNSVALAALGRADTLAGLFVARTLSGIFGANISTAYAFVSDTTTPQNRTKYFGLLGAAFGLGFTFGPGIGGLLSKVSFSAPMYLAASLSFLDFAVGYFWLKEPPELKQVRLAARREKALSKAAILQVLQHKPSRVGILIFFLFTLSLTQMEVMFAVYMAALFGFTAHSTGYLMFGLGLIMVFVQGGLIGRVSKYVSDSKMILACTLVCGLAMAIYGSTHHLYLAILALACLSAARGFLQPSLTSLVTKEVPATRRGTTMGVFQSGSSLARVLGPLSAGWLYQHVSAETPFLFAALLFFLAFVYARGSLQVIDS